MSLNINGKLKIPVSLLLEVGFLYEKESFVFPSQYDAHPEKIILNGGHIVPGTTWWENQSLYGNTSVYIFDSVIQALSYITLKKINLDAIDMVAIGNSSLILKEMDLREIIKDKKIILAFPNTTIGKINETLFAFEYRKKQLEISLNGDFILCKRNGIEKRIAYEKFSFNRLMKEFGMLLKNIRTTKPSSPHKTFYEML